MTDKWMYIPNDDTQDYPSVDYNQWLKNLNAQLNKTNKSKSNMNPKGCQSNEYEDIVKRLWGLV